MLLSNSKMAYSSVRRMPTVKLNGQTQGTTITTMPMSTSLQDINTHSQQLVWQNSKEKDERLISFSGQFLPTNHGRQLSASHSDERVFEHPEVTIKPSALDDEIQRRLLTMKTSSTDENLLDREGGRSAPNILEHPDMRSPVIRLSQQLSSSSSPSFVLPEHKRLGRTQSAEPGTTMITGPSLQNRVDFYIDNRENSIQYSLLGSSSVGQQDQTQTADFLTTALLEVSVHKSSEASSNPTVDQTKAKKNDSW